MKTVKEAGLVSWLRSHSSWVILGITILLAVVLYAIVFWYQAGRPSREQAEQAWPAAGETPCLIAGSAYTVELSLIYPQRLLYEPSAPSRPVSIRLQARTVPTESEEMEGWTVAFSWPDQGVVFTDQAGAEIAPRVVITPGVESVELAVLYVRRSALADVPHELPLTIRVYEPLRSGPVLITELPAVKLESDAQARWRRFWDMVLGPATPLVGLGGGLIALVVKEWLDGRKREREQEQERSKAAKLAHIEALWDLRGNIVQAAREYVEIRRKVQEDPDWQDDDLRKRLAEVWGRFSVQDLQDGAVRVLCEDDYENARMLVKLAREKGDGKDITDALDKLLEGQATEKVQAWLAVGRNYGRRPQFGQQVHGAMASQLAQLISKGEANFPNIASQLDEYEYLEQLVDEPPLEEALRQKATFLTPNTEREAALKLLEKRPAKDWLQLWSEIPGNVWPLLTYWLNQREIHSPFGPDEAELDPCLPFYSVEGPLLRCIQTRKPVVLFAQPGSGRTAAALLLAHFCHRDGVFPVYHVPPPNAGENSLLEMARATAATIARYLAYNAEGFFKLARSRQFSLVHLLALWVPFDDIEGELQRRGLRGKSLDPRLIDEIKKLYPSSPLAHSDGQNILELLNEARPHGFDCFYWILDLPSDQPGESRLPLARFLQTLLGLETRLAARNIFLKLLLPEDLKPYLRPPSDTIEPGPWSPDELKALLEQRFAGYRTLLQRFFPQPSDQDCFIAEAHGSPRDLIRAANRRFYELKLDQQSWHPDQPSYWQPYEHEQFEDREKELQKIDQYLADSERRVTFVLGDAGIGKTWLLHEVAWRLESQQKAYPLYFDLAENWRDNFQSVRLTIDAIVAEIERARGTSQTIVLFVDSVDQVPFELTGQLEEKVLIKAIQRGPVVIAERGRSRRWREQENTNQIVLETPCLSSVLRAEREVWAVLGGSQALYPYLEALSILRAFDDVRIGEVLKIRFPDEPWDYDACLEMRKKLLATTMVSWVKEKRGYIIDEPLRLLLEAALRQKDERLWRNLHCVAYRLYEKWAADFEQSRGDWLREREYHADVLKQHGYDPTHCQPLLETSE